MPASDIDVKLAIKGELQRALAHSGTVWTGGRVLLHRADVLALLEAPSAGSQPA